MDLVNFVVLSVFFLEFDGDVDEKSDLSNEFIKEKIICDVEIFNRMMLLFFIFIFEDDIIDVDSGSDVLRYGEFFGSNFILIFLFLLVILVLVLRMKLKRYVRFNSDLIQLIIDLENFFEGNILKLFEEFNQVGWELELNELL